MSKTLKIIIFFIVFSVFFEAKAIIGDSSLVVYKHKKISKEQSLPINRQYIFTLSDGSEYSTFYKIKNDSSILLITPNKVVNINEIEKIEKEQKKSGLTMSLSSLAMMIITTALLIFVVISIRSRGNSNGEEGIIFLLMAFFSYIIGIPGFIAGLFLTLTSTIYFHSSDEIIIK